MTAHATTFPRPGLPRLSGIELRKMADTRAGFWLLLIVELCAAGIVTVQLIAGKAPDKDFASLFQSTLWAVSVLLPVLGILVITSEWSQRTGLTTFALVPERGRVVAAKLAAAVGLGALSVVACLVTAAAANVIAGGSWSLATSAIPHGVLFQVLGMLVGAAFGLAFLNSALAIVVYFVLPTVWAILGQTIHALDKPAEWLDQSRTLPPLVDGGMTGQDWGQLGTSMALWLGAFLLVGLWRLRRSELK